METLRIIATINIKHAYLDQFKEEIKQLIKLSRKEEGCRQYELYQEISDPLLFVIMEMWDSQQSIDKHNNTEHFKHFVNFINDKVTYLDIKVLKIIH